MTTDKIARGIAVQSHKKIESVEEKASLAYDLALNALGGKESNIDSLINFSFFGAVGDGETDDTEAFKTYCNYVNDGGKRKLIGSPGKVYLLNEALVFNKAPKIDLNGAEIKWTGRPPTANNSREIGMIFVEGLNSQEQYQIQNIFLERDYKSNDISSFPTDGYVDLSGPHTLKKGDFVHLEVHTGEYTPERINPKDSKMLKVIRVKDNRIFLNYTNPFKIHDFVFTGTLSKVIPVKGVDIQNLVLNDAEKIEGEKNPNSSYPGKGDKFVSGISLKYCEDATIRNVAGKNTKFPVLFVRYSSNIHVADGRVIDPAIVGPGEGYYAQFNFSNRISVKRVYGERARHVVDFTCCSFAEVDTAAGFSMYATAFQLHGYYEHNIHYKNTVGNFGGVSGQQFGEANQLVTFDNHQGWINARSYNKSVIVRNSKVRLIGGIMDVRFINSEIKWYGIHSTISTDVRSDVMERKIKFVDCDIELYGDTLNVSFADYSEILLSDSHLWAETELELNISAIEHYKMDDFSTLKNIILIQ